MKTISNILFQMQTAPALLNSTLLERDTLAQALPAADSKNIGFAKKYSSLLKELLVPTYPLPEQLSILDAVYPFALRVSDTLAFSDVNSGHLKSKNLIESHELLATFVMHYEQVAYLLSAQTQSTKKIFLVSAPQSKRAIGTALFRAMECQSAIYIECKKNYLSLYDGYWLKLHSLYKTALSEKVHHLKFKAIYGGEKKTTIAEIYAQVLLLEIFNMNGFNRLEMNDIFLMIDSLAKEISITTQPKNEAKYVVDLSTDTGIQHSLYQTPPDTHELLYIDTESLIRALDHQQSTKPSLVRLRNRLLQDQLTSRGRLDERRSASGFRELTIGFAPTYSSLCVTADQQIRDQILAEQDANDCPRTHDILTPEQTNANDMSMELTRTGDHRFVFNPQSSYQLYVCNVINSSAHGYCFRLNFMFESGLRAGEIVLIHAEEPAETRLGLVRWLSHQIEGHSLFGVEVLDHVPQASKAMLKDKGNYSGHIVNTIALLDGDRVVKVLVPFLDLEDTEITLITYDHTLHLRTINKAMIGSDYFIYDAQPLTEA